MKLCAALLADHDATACILGPHASTFICHPVQKWKPSETNDNNMYEFRLQGPRQLLEPIARKWNMALFEKTFHTKTTKQEVSGRA